MVVVGAGPGGLVSALLAASKGMDVTVLERVAEVGGRTSLLQSGGFTFDRGPTFCFMPEIIRSIVRDCGFDLDREIGLRRIDPIYTVIFPDGRRLAFSSDLEAMARQVAAFDPAEVAGLRRFWRDSERKVDALMPLLTRDFGRKRDLLKADMLRSLPHLRPWRSVGQEVRRYFRHPLLQQAFSFQSAYLGMTPGTCPSLFSIVPFLEAADGAVHPMGGCGALMQCLAGLAERRGVRIRLGEAAEALTFKDGRVSGVRTAQAIYDADAVILNGDFTTLVPRLVPEAMRRGWPDRRIARQALSTSVFSMFFGVEGHTALPHHTMAIDRFNGGWEALEAGRIPHELGFYVHNPTVTDPSLAPAGCSTIYVAQSVPNLAHRHDWDDTGLLRSQVIAALKRLGADIEHRIRFEAVQTPRDWQDEGIHLGAVYSMQHSVAQMTVWRPPNRFGRDRGIYLVGSGTHPGSGLPLIFTSARISVDLMMGDLRGTVPGRLAGADALVLQEGA